MSNVVSIVFFKPVMRGTPTFSAPLLEVAPPMARDVLFSDLRHCCAVGRSVLTLYILHLGLLFCRVAAAADDAGVVYGEVRGR
jgi:hypothetical protein